MIILGIESSCDETGLALLEISDDGCQSQLLGEVLASQIKLHELYGGVVPELCIRDSS